MVLSQQITIRPFFESTRQVEQLVLFSLIKKITRQPGCVYSEETSMMNTTIQSPIESIPREKSSPHHAAQSTVVTTEKQKNEEYEQENEIGR